MMISLFGNSINGLNHRAWVQNLQKSLDAVAMQLKVYRFREYRLVVGFKEYRIRVPIIDDDQGKVLCWPAGMLRRRPYPLAVYLFAVCVYVTSELSMRETATLARSQFGLDRFSHSTISRSKSKLLCLLATYEQEFPPIDSDADCSGNLNATSSLLQRLRLMLQEIRLDPFHHAEKLALHFFLRYQAFLL